MAGINFFVEQLEGLKERLRDQNGVLSVDSLLCVNVARMLINQDSCITELEKQIATLKHAATRQQEDTQTRIAEALEKIARKQGY